MIGEQSGINAGGLATLYLGLILFGIGYNGIITWAERHGYLQGYTAFFVVGGTLITIGATVAVIGPLATMIVVGAFIASGTPMIMGSMWRHMQEWEAEANRIRREAHHDDPDETMAE